MDGVVRANLERSPARTFGTGIYIRAGIELGGFVFGTGVLFELGGIRAGIELFLKKGCLEVSTTTGRGRAEHGYVKKLFHSVLIND